MRTAGVAFLVSMILAAALTPLVRRLALSRGWLDQAIGSRKLHGRPVPRVGGLAIVLSFVAPLLLLRLVQSPMGERLWSDASRVWSLLAGGAAIAALGLWDDLRGTGAAKKLVVQSAVAILLWSSGFRIETLATPFGGTVATGALALPLTLLWIVGVINAMNLIDGLDGLAGGVAVFALGSSFVVAFVRGEVTMALFSAALAGSVLGFLFYNWNPASIFMGDTGSMFLGYVLAAGSILTNQKSSTAVALLVPIVALGLPIADTLLAIARRASRGRPIFSADREHIHHRLLASGLSPQRAVLVLWGACALLALCALVLSFANSVSVAATLVALAAAGVVAVRRLGYLTPGAGSERAERRQHNQALRRSVRAAGVALSKSASVDEVFAIARGLREGLSASRLVLDLGAGGVFRDEAPAPEGPALPVSLSASFALHGEPSPGLLLLDWSDGRTAIDRDDEIAAELLSDHLSGALERLAPARPLR